MNNQQQYPVELANELLNKQEPNTYFAVFMDYTGSEHIEQLNAPNVEEAEDIAMSLYEPGEIDFVLFIDEYIRDKVSTINNDISNNYQLLQLVGGQS